MEFYLFTHFGPNTFTDKEWGQGDEPEDVFNPTKLDCEQWCRVAKAAGAKGIIITAKHHDGFCLWPSKFSKHTVRESKWKDGKGDVLKELSAACKKIGLKFGIYISPWDRNHPDYGTAAYNDVFVNMMKEIFTHYGPVWELWWDGANGEGPNGKKQVYDWDRFRKTVKQLSPNTVIFSDVGPHIRWVGNERGIAGQTNWNYLDTVGFTAGIGAPSVDTLNKGNINGKAWIPAECDVSIRPGWFYHAEEDDKVKTPEQLFQLYLKSVGRGANLLLNVPPDRRGLINENDSASLIAFAHLRKNNFKENLCKRSIAYYSVNHRSYDAKKVIDGLPHTFVKLKQNDPVSNSNEALKITLPGITPVNCIVLMEAIQNGQMVKEFELTLWQDQTMVEKIKGTTIGRKRILTFPEQKVTSVTLSIMDAKGMAEISEMAAYLINPAQIEKE
jgi:alpha-L-fucosidase